MIDSGSILLFLHLLGGASWLGASVFANVVFVPFIGRRPSAERPELVRRGRPTGSPPGTCRKRPGSKASARRTSVGWRSARRSATMPAELDPKTVASLSRSAEHGRRIVGVLRRAAARPIGVTAPQGSAAIVGHDREVLETLGDCAPDLGIFAPAVDDQEGRS